MFKNIMTKNKTLYSQRHLVTRSSRTKYNTTDKKNSNYIEKYGVLSSVVVSLSIFIYTECKGFSREITSQFLTLNNTIESKIASLENKVDARFNTMESKMEAKFTALESKVEAKFTALESKMDVKITALESKVDAKITQLDRKIDDLDKKYKR